MQTFIIKKITEQISRRTNADIRIGKVEIAFFKRVILNDVLISGPERDTIFYTEWVSAKVDSFNYWKHRIAIDELTFEDNKISISRDSSNRFNFSFILDSLRSEAAKERSFWKISCNQFHFKGSEIIYQDAGSAKARHISVHKMNLNISDFQNERDSFQFNINEFSMNDGKNFFLNHFSARLKFSREKIEVKAINMKTKQSEINDLNVVLKYAEDARRLDKTADFDIQLSDSRISLPELGELFPALKGMHQDVDISGRVYGTLNDIKGKDVSIKTATNTSATLDFYVNDIEDIENMYLFLDLKKLETTFSDISKFTFPLSSGIKPIQFPDSFYKAGLFRFKGNFSGFLSDFVTFGTLTSKMGMVKTDVSVVPEANKSFHFNGKVSTKEFKIGQFLNVEKLGNITFNGEADGSYKMSNKQIEGLFKGDISKIEANGYVYQNIQLDGIYVDKMFDGMVNMNDSNLQFTFLGRMDLKAKSPAFDFNLNVDKILPAKLNLIHNFPNSEVAFNMKAKFTGNKIDNLKGVILMEDGYYKNRFGDFSLKGLQLISVAKAEASELTFISDYFDVQINGDYQFQNLLYDLKKNINHFIPAFRFETPKNIAPNNFDFKIDIKDLDPITSVFIPDLQLKAPFFLYGKMDANKSGFQLEGSVPAVRYKNVTLKNIFIVNKPASEHYSSKFKIGEITLKNGFSIYNMAIESQFAGNVLTNLVEWDSDKVTKNTSSIKSTSLFSARDPAAFPIIKTKFSPADIYLSDTLWHYGAFTSIIDTSTIVLNGFRLENKVQSIAMSGTVSKDSSSTLGISVENVDLARFLGVKNKTLRGNANGAINVSDVYRTPIISVNMGIDGFQFENHLIGDVSLLSRWNPVKQLVDAQLGITKDNRESLMATGFYHPKSKDIDFVVSVDSMPIILLETAIKDQLSGFKGTATGKVKFGGNLDKFTMDGAVKVDNGGLKIDYTQTEYSLEDSVYFKTDTILFQRITIRDKFNNTGRLNGILVHDNFKNMLYDFTVSSTKIMALNTSLRSTDVFFGDIFANCQIKIFGRGPSLSITGSGTTLPGTSVNILMEYESDMQQYDFLEFVQSDERAPQDLFLPDAPKGNFNMSLTVEATPQAKVQLIYNSQIGDIIKAQGEGILLFEMNNDGDIFLSGNYSVTSGDYLFTLQNLINKRFTIAPGGSIIWSGNPYNANIDLSAIYKLKASLSDLLAGNSPNTDNLYQRIPVECVINLTDELINPTIGFEVRFPDENEGTRNELQQYFNTEEEKNKQILSLIVLGKFYTPEYMRGQYESQNSNMFGATASELFSNQLSNWLSQINNNIDFGVKYRPGNSITNDELELALSTQIFNDRVTLDGNIGNNVNPESSNGSQIVGDFDIRVKLVPSGKIQFKAYNHSNNNLIYETAPYTQGVGLTFKEEYNTFQELMHKVGSLFKRRKKKQ